MEPLAELMGESLKIVALRDRAAQLVRAWAASRRPPPIVIQGETGTGKGLLARALHRASARRGHPFVHQNCAALPETLLESELFGYERGAYTDARQSKPGLFQLADRGTLFLDEIGLLTPAMQAKLLSVIEDRTARRLGAVRAEPIDVWVMAATNEDLGAAIRTGAFREDLYHRLAVVTLELPPLRERDDDMVLLAARFLARACADYDLPAKSLSGDALEALRSHGWPGNVRELANVMERTALLSDAAVITAAHLALPRGTRSPGRGEAAPPRAPVEPQSSRDVMSQHLLQVLEQTGWNISRSAALLGVSRNTVTARIARYGLRPPAPRGEPRVASSEEAELRAAPPLPAGGVRWEPRRLLYLSIRLAGPDETDPGARPLLTALADKIRDLGGLIEGLGPAAIYAVFGTESTDDAAVLATHGAMSMRSAAFPSKVTIGLHVARTLVRIGGGAPTPDVEGSRRAGRELDAITSAASAGTIVATPAAAEMLRRRFALTPLLPPAEGFRVDGVWPARVGGAHPRGRFVGRGEELSLLENRLASALEGRGQAVDVAAEAGMGKSRLLVELGASPRMAATRYLEGRCLPTATQTPFFPLLQIVRQACGIADAMPAAKVRERIALAAATIEDSGETLAADLAHLLDPETSAPAAASAAAQRKRLFTAIQRLLFQQAAAGPLVVAVEDLHWVDPSSEACLAALVEVMGGVPMLLVTTHRPGYRPSWASVPHALRLALPPLAPADSLVMIRELLESSPPPAALEHGIQERAEGNPLFLEELSRAAADGQGPEEIPTTIEATIAARLDRLQPRQRRILTTAAVVGRDFSLRLLGELLDLSPKALEAPLAHLQRADVVHPAGLHEADTIYAFKHALVQEVAYARLSPPERRALHVRVLDAMERLEPGCAGEQVEQLAHHAVCGDARPRAVRYLLQAGQRAAARSALIEALARLDAALGLLRTLPEGAERDRQELALELARAGALRAMRGFAAPEVGQACARAMELCHRSDDTAQLMPTLNGVYSFHLMRAEYARAGEAAAELLGLARRLGDGTFEMIGHRATGAVLFHTGRFVEARVALEHALALHESGAHQGLAAGDGTDHAQVTSCFLGLTLWALGHPAEARRRLEWAVKHSERLGHLHSTGLALSHLGILLLVARDYEAVPHAIAPLVDLAARHALTVLERSGRFFLAAARQPRTRQSVEEMRRAAEAWWATQATGYRPFVEVVLAEARAEIGDVAGGLRLIADARAHLEESNERWIEAELHRVHGLLLAADPRRGEEAERRLRLAVDVARAQQATMWELRGATALATWLWLGSRGGPARTRELLGPILARFPDMGPAMPDLLGARALYASVA